MEPAKPHEPHLWLITVEATLGKQPGKRCKRIPQKITLAGILGSRKTSFFV